MMLTAIRTALVATLLAAAIVVPAAAGVVVYEEGDKKIEIGARVQLQYKKVDPDDPDDPAAESTDTLFFRRLRPYIMGTVTEDWVGKVQFDFGKAGDDDEVAVKDAYMQYLGVDRHKITVGNSKTPFSREFLASSKRQQLIERSFVGDHNFGTPDRQLGIRLDGKSDNKKVSYAASLGMENHDPSAGKMDFDTPANNKSDWNEGVGVAGRVDIHPKGIVKFDQGDFHSDEVKFNFSLAAFNWDNDDDNNTYTDAGGNATSSSKADLDSANGVELSAGVRGKGFSADAEYQMVSADTVDPGFTGGLYRDGSTDLDKLAFEGGYMIGQNSVEIVVGWDSLDADNYETAYERTSVGLNYFWNKHKAKLQFTYRMSEGVDGVMNVDEDEIFGQAQFVF